MEYKFDGLYSAVGAGDAGDAARPSKSFVEQNWSDRGRIKEKFGQKWSDLDKFD